MRLFFILLAITQAGANSKTGSNVVFVVLDDLGYADVGFTQDEALAEVATPNIDKLAREGVIFTNGYSSGEVCAPTRAGFMLGRYQQGVGIYSARSGGGDGMEILRYNEYRGRYFNVNPWMSQFLKQAGTEVDYITGAFGKWHLGLDVVLKVGDDGIYRYKSRTDTLYGNSTVIGESTVAFPLNGPMVKEGFAPISPTISGTSRFDEITNSNFVPCNWERESHPCFELKNNTYVPCAWVFKKKRDERCSRYAFNGSVVNYICPAECSAEPTLLPVMKGIPKVYKSIAPLGEAGSVYHPLYRGFDVNHIFMGRGAKDYWDENDFYVSMDKDKPTVAKTSGLDDRKNPGNTKHPNKTQEPTDTWDAVAEDYIIHRQRTPSTYVTNNITDAAIEFIRTNAGEARPFLVYVPYNAPHYPAQSPYHMNPETGKLDRMGEDTRRYAGMSREDFAASGIEHRWFEPDFDDGEWFPDPIFIYETYRDSGFTDIGVESFVECCTDDDLRRRSITTAMNRWVDKGVGQIVAALKDPNGDGDTSDSVYEDTMIVLISDNGGAAKMRASNKPLRGTKGELFEGGHRVPFFITWDKYLSNVDGKGTDVRGTSCDAPITSLDILPTILDANGINDPSMNPLLRSSPSDGKSLLPLLDGSVTKLHEYLFWAYERTGNAPFEGAVRREDWKLIINRRDSSGLDLFDLLNDPGETRNLVAEYPDIVNELKEAFVEWMNEMAQRNGEEVPNWRLAEMFGPTEDDQDADDGSEEGATISISFNRSDDPTTEQQGKQSVIDTSVNNVLPSSPATRLLAAAGSIVIPTIALLSILH